MVLLSTGNLHNCLRSLALIVLVLGSLDGCFVLQVGTMPVRRIDNAIQDVMVGHPQARQRSSRILVSKYSGELKVRKSCGHLLDITL